MSETAAGQDIAAALRERERQLAEAQRVAHLGSWEWDVAADRTSWSDEAVALLVGWCQLP
jgi:two-component system sensor histidine kinase/response regulator